MTNSLYRRCGKRCLDVCAGLGLLIAAVPVLAVAALAVRFHMGTPVLFRQRRAGVNGAPFTILKFRTMREMDGPASTDTDAARLTRFGRILRATSIDELPELWNVVRGDMSLVGPRPLLMQYLPRYSPAQFRRHEVRPGITGLAQTAGRNALSWERKFELDVEYVDRCSLLLDLQILIRTLRAVIAGDGISQPGHVTAAEFPGSQP